MVRGRLLGARLRLAIAGLTAVASCAIAAVPAAAAHRRTSASRHVRVVRGAPAGLGSVVVRRTAFGIPHIRASTFEGLGYGDGYAFAQDDLCTMADAFITVDGERSRFFGPDGHYFVEGTFYETNNLDSDFFWRQIADARTIEKLVAQPPPKGPEPEVLQLARGYAAGYNRYLASVGGSPGVPDSRCRGKPWVRPITATEVWRRIYELEEFASGIVQVGSIAEAQPPAAGVLPSGLTIPGSAAARGVTAGDAGMRRARPARSLLPPGFGARLRRRLRPALGSNAVAVGRAGTRDHRHGLLLGNPHFPWMGPQRFYQAQLTIPGRMNVEGASLFGAPLILIGHTANMAWSHTVSPAFNFQPYQLQLVPGDPTSYFVDGRPEAMTRRTLTVQALGGDGRLHPVTRTLYSSRYGPIINSLVGALPLPWTTATAFTQFDAERDILGRVANTFLGFDQAQSAAQMLSILKRYEGIPFVHTIVADRHGDALYADIASIPNIPDSKVSQCDTPLGAATFQQAGLGILDGSNSACAPGTDPDAIEPGIFGPSHLPHLVRADYVTNSNDSYWLSNPHQPLQGFARILGTEGTERSLRTRIGLLEVQARVDGSDGLGPAGFTRQDMQNLDLGDQVYSAELTRDALVAMCRGMPGGLAPTSSGPPVAIGAACDVLANWDLRADIDSRGELLFRQFWAHACGPFPDPTCANPAIWSNPFSSSDPVHTPNGLNTADPTVRTALGDAIQDLEGAHIPLDATVGSQQYVQTASGRIPIPGGPADPNGVFNAIIQTFTPGTGYGPITLGSSYVQAVTWHDGPCPDAATLLTYSLSDNPSSPHYADQTALFSRKQWVTERFCARDVLAHTQSTTVLGRGTAPSRRRPAQHRRPPRRRGVRHHRPRRPARFTG